MEDVGGNWATTVVGVDRQKMEELLTGFHTENVSATCSGTGVWQSDIRSSTYTEYSGAEKGGDWG